MIEEYIYIEKRTNAKIMFQISQRTRRFPFGKSVLIFPSKKFLLKNDVPLQAVRSNPLLAGFSLESDLNDWCVVLLVVLLEGKQGLDEVPVLVFDVFGLLTPLFPSFVV